MIKQRIYSSMFGKKSSLIQIKNYLGEKNIKNISHTEFSQGKTTRWGIAWSFTNDCLPQVNSLKKGDKLKKEKTMTIDFLNSMNQLELRELVHKILLNDLKVFIFRKKSSRLKLLFSYIPFKFEQVENSENTFFAFENTWSYQRAKRRKLARNEELSLASNDDEDRKRKTKEPSFQFKIIINQTNNGAYRIELNPIERYEPKVYESLNQILQYLKNRLSSIK